MSKSYRGHRMGQLAQVWVLDHTGGHVLDQPPSLRIRIHNPVRFAWGCEDSAATQLALALLLEHTKDPTKAEAHYQEFKEVFIANWRRVQSAGNGLAGSAFANKPWCWWYPKHVIVTQSGGRDV